MSSPIARLGDRSVSPDAEPVVVRVNDEAADAVLDSLGSDTARALFEAVHDDPAPPSELADRIDTSVQNVHYHLSNLRAAGVVEPVGTRYSEKGNEMTVYGPAADPIVLTGERDPGARADLGRTLRDWATGVAALGFASLAVQLGVERLTAGGAADLFEPASRGTGDPSGLVALALAVAEPGLLFFLGGLLVFVAVAVRERADHGA
jgi:DNA-binding transcriptional ArsR family regulator